MVPIFDRGVAVLVVPIFEGCGNIDDNRGVVPIFDRGRGSINNRGVVPIFDRGVAILIIGEWFLF